MVKVKEGENGFVSDWTKERQEKNIKMENQRIPTWKKAILNSNLYYIVFVNTTSSDCYYKYKYTSICVNLDRDVSKQQTIFIIFGI